MPPTDPVTSDDARRDGVDTTMRVGTGLLLIGVVASVVTLVPFLTGAEPLPLIAYLLALLAPVGLGVVLLAFWRRARGRRSRLSTTTGEVAYRGSDGPESG